MSYRFTPGNTAALTAVAAPAKYRKFPAHFGNMGYPSEGMPWASRWTYDKVVKLHRYVGRLNTPRAAILHTVEEDADDYEAAPIWFASALAPNSMHYYGDDDGDLYHMVDDRHPAWGHGTHSGNTREPRPLWWDGYSYNTSSLGYELEGRAHEITARWAQHFADHGEHHPQRVTVTKWIAYVSTLYDFPIDRAHVMGHEELSTGKSDPGIELYGFPIDELIADALALAPERDPHQDWIDGWRSGWSAGHASGVLSAVDLLRELNDEDPPQAPTPTPPLLRDR